MRQKIAELSKNLAIYGLGDAGIHAINFLLLPVYVQYLSKFDYGVLALLASVEAVTKLFFRWGVDGSFMRFWYECEDEDARRRLSSTLFFFLLGLNGALLLLATAASGFISERVLGAPGYTLALQLVLLNTFCIGFTFIPFQMLRMEKRAREFATLTVSRSVATLVLRIVLVVGLEMSIYGVIVADLIVTGIILAVMLPSFARMIRPMFSTAVLRSALAFGLPRVPHGFALQVMAVGDRFVLTRFRPLEDLGLYSMGVSFGLIPKIALGAFEYAWAPFYYATSREPDARRVFSAITTYGVALLALMTAGLSAIARDLLDVVTHGVFVAASGVVVWTAVGVFFYGVYLLTSIGLNITRQTQYYPVSTATGAATNIGLNILLIPHYGILGAAWANAAAYGLQAAIAFGLSQRLYPVDYERGRLTRAIAAAAIGYVAAAQLPGMTPIAGVVVRGATVTAVMAAILWTTGFFRAEELRGLNALRRRLSGAAPVTTPPDTTEMAGEIVSADLPDEGVPR